MSGLGGIGGGGGIQQILAMRQQILDRSSLLKDVHSAAQGPQGTEAANGPADGFTGALRSALDGVSATQRNAEDLSAAFAHAAVDSEHGADDRSFLFAAQEEGEPQISQIRSENL